MIVGEGFASTGGVETLLPMQGAAVGQKVKGPFSIHKHTMDTKKISFHMEQVSLYPEVKRARQQ